MLQWQRHNEDAMIRRPFALIALVMVLVISISRASRGAQVGASGIDAGNGPIICSVMEAFEEGRLGVRAIIFHQRNKADGPRLGALLLAHSGEEMELETMAGQHYRATVFRIKSAFGRGLVLVPTSRLKLGAHDEFTLRLPEKN
jgi:hypothetical protein